MDTFEAREKLKLMRRKLPEKEMHSKSALIKEHLFSFSPFRKAQAIAFYVSIKDQREVDTDEMIRESLAMGKRVCVPKVIRDRLALFEIKDFGRDLSRGTMGILEPRGGAQLAPELVIVPGIAFDSSGNRIGFGRGYYDRLLAALENTRSIGLAYSFQITDRIIPGKHDVRMDYIITEKGVRECRS